MLGSSFSLMVIAAVACGVKTVHRPSRAPDSATTRATSRVTSTTWLCSRVASSKRRRKTGMAAVLITPVSRRRHPQTPAQRLGGTHERVEAVLEARERIIGVRGVHGEQRHVEPRA